MISHSTSLTANPARMSASQSADKPRVLIVDDEPANIQTLAHLIKDEYHVQVATSGEKALEIAAGDPQPDLVLLDVVMPETDGYEVCRRLKADPQMQRIPVIFVTGRDSAEDEEYGLKLGAMDYITKPFAPTVVRVRVRNQVDLKRKTDELEELSERDVLTDLPNRRQCDRKLREEWNRARRRGTPLSVFVMDVDHFKPYNDHYGHRAGDEGLRRVGHALAGVPARPMDLVARYGGEEFAAVLPYTQADGGSEMAERFRLAVAELELPHAYATAAGIVTVSVGFATRVPDPADDGPESLLEAADRALYAAKEAGRNRVHEAT